MDLIDNHHDRNAFDRAKTLAWTQAQVQLRHLGIEAEEAADFQRLAAPLIYSDPRFRASSDAIVRGAGMQSGLWPHAISGDLPIFLLRIDRHRGYRSGPAVTESARILANEASRRRSGDRQRASLVVSPGVAGRDRSSRAQQSVATALRRRTRARCGLYAPRRFDERGGAGVAAIGGSRRTRRAPWFDCRAARALAASAGQAHGVRSGRSRRCCRLRPRRPMRRVRSRRLRSGSSFSMASAASTRTAANM